MVLFSLWLGATAMAQDAEPAPLMTWDDVVVLERRQPDFPERAPADGLETLCVLELHVDAQGQPRRVETLNCPAPFSGEAIPAAMAWRLEPLIQDGTATPFRLSLTFRFTAPDPPAPRTALENKDER